MVNVLPSPSPSLFQSLFYEIKLDILNHLVDAYSTSAAPAPAPSTTTRQERPHQRAAATLMFIPGFTEASREIASRYLHFDRGKERMTQWLDEGEEASIFKVDYDHDGNGESESDDATTNGKGKKINRFSGTRRIVITYDKATRLHSPVEAYQIEQLLRRARGTQSLSMSFTFASLLDISALSHLSNLTRLHLKQVGFKRSTSSSLSFSFSLHHLHLSRIESTVSDALLRGACSRLHSFTALIDSANIYPSLNRVGASLKDLRVTLSLIRELPLPLLRAVGALRILSYLQLSNFDVAQCIELLAALPSSPSSAAEEQGEGGGLQKLDMTFFNITPNAAQGLLDCLRLPSLMNLKRWRLVGYKGDRMLIDIPRWETFSQECDKRGVQLVVDQEW